jgi:hypothetical protein
MLHYMAVSILYTYDMTIDKVKNQVKEKLIKSYFILKPMLDIVRLLQINLYFVLTNMRFRVTLAQEVCILYFVCARRINFVLEISSF